MNGQGVLEWLERYAAAWRSNRSDEIIACWDQDAFLFYKAEEEPVFFDQWSRLERYWRQNEGLHERVILRFSDPMVKTARPGLLVATVNMRWDIRFANDARLADGQPFMHRGKAMGGDNHVLLMLEETPAGFRLVAWSETPDAPLSYLRGLYFKQADRDALS